MDAMSVRLAELTAENAVLGTDAKESSNALIDLVAKFNDLSGDMERLDAKLQSVTAERDNLKATLARVQSAAKSGMDAATQVGHWQMQEARRLKAECSPANASSQRDVIEQLTNENEVLRRERDRQIEIAAESKP